MRSDDFMYSEWIRIFDDAKSFDVQVVDLSVCSSLEDVQSIDKAEICAVKVYVCECEEWERRKGDQRPQSAIICYE